jgi:hypothetical protein
MKRYLVFIGLSYYPEGGGSDFAFATDELDEAKAKAESIFGNKEDMWAEVFDAEDCKTVIGFNWNAWQQRPEKRYCKQPVPYYELEEEFSKLG